MSNNLREVRNAIGLGHMETARQLLRPILNENPSAEAYFLASKVALDDEQREDFLRQALELDPYYQPAADALSGKTTKPKNTEFQGYDAMAERFGASDSQSSTYQGSFSAGISPSSKQGEYYELADSGQRLFAFIVDQIVLFFIGIFVSFFFGFFIDLESINVDGNINATVQLIGILSSAIYMCYFLSRAVGNGQTPGKTLMGIRVVKKNGQPLSVIDAFIRNVLGYSISSFFLLIGFLWIFVDENRQGWHDKLAGTIVIKDSKKQKYFKRDQ
jgi:uncharacterized RDD family membrane protein YckC